MEDILQALRATGLSVSRVLHQNPDEDVEERFEIVEWVMLVSLWWLQDR